MAVTTQQQFAVQMVAQLRALDPAFSAEIGTPERKLIDTTAQVLAENQIDITVLSGALDLDAKHGANLDSFLALLGFGRHQATYATGFVTFSRPTASNFAIPVPIGTQVMAPNVTQANTNLSRSLTFITTFTVTLPAGQTSVVVPIQAVSPGSDGNVGAGQITTMINQPVTGVTTITNENPTKGGLDAEDDDELKTRFRNTVFRNMAGTPDMYLALAVATAFTTKANVVGPISRYREYIQIPDADDASLDPDSQITGGGAAGEYTAALSTIPYSKHVYDNIPYYVTNGKTGSRTLFFRQDSDYVLNAPAIDAGDTYRQRLAGVGYSVTDAKAAYRPNITFYNVYTGIDADIEAIRPSDIVLFEHSYLSNKSRNDTVRNIHNCVDLFIDGGNELAATSVIAPPKIGNAFINNPTHRFHYNNFRRANDPHRRPVIGNLFSPLFWQPVTWLPDEITVGSTIYKKGLHYWLVEDVSEIGRTVRARNGIEWSVGVNGIAQADTDVAPWTGPKIAANPDAVEVIGYLYDQNLLDLQTALEGSKQTTTDVLAHKSRKRYFKFDITAMYNRGVDTSNTNEGVRIRLQTLLDGNYYGSTIQLSDLLSTIHDTGGIDNVRWSQDILPIRNRVIECDVDGNPLLNVLVDQVTAGDATTVEVQRLYIAGEPTSGSYNLVYGASSTEEIAFDADTAAVNDALAEAGIPATVTGGGTYDNPFLATFAAVGIRTMFGSVVKFTAGAAIFNDDFFLEDDELPSLPESALATDTLPGLTIRPRAQNTWSQL